MVQRGRQARFPRIFRSCHNASRAHFRMGPRGDVFVARRQCQLRQAHIPRGHELWQAHQAAAWRDMVVLIGQHSIAQVLTGTHRKTVARLADDVVKSERRSSQRICHEVGGTMWISGGRPAVVERPGGRRLEQLLLRETRGCSPRRNGTTSRICNGVASCS